jgi:hypothetical protein
MIIDVFVGNFQLLICHVHTYYMTAFTSYGRGKEYISASAASKIQDCLALYPLRNGTATPVELFNDIFFRACFSY